jgi:hypothetical protein
MRRCRRLQRTVARRARKTILLDRLHEVLDPNFMPVSSEGCQSLPKVSFRSIRHDMREENTPAGSAPFAAQFFALSGFREKAIPGVETVS